MLPTDVSPTENSWMLRPLNKASLGYCAPDRCVPTLDRVKHGTRSVGKYRVLRRPPAPNESVGRLAGLAYTPDQVYWISAPPMNARSATHRTLELHRFAALKREPVGSRVSLRSMKSEFRDGMVRSGAK